VGAWQPRADFPTAEWLGWHTMLRHGVAFMANDDSKLSIGRALWIVVDFLCALAWFALPDAASAQPNQDPASQPEELPAPPAVQELTVKPAIFTRTRLNVPPEERRAALAAAIEEVRQSGILERAIHVGDKAIDFQLPESMGSNLRASDLWSMGPVVLVFYRGGWCPYCNRYLHELQRALDDMQTLDAQLVAISPELQERALATQAKHKLAFPLLSDKGNAIARQYGIAYRIPQRVVPFYDELFDLRRANGDDSYELPLTATYVVDRAGVVRYAFLDPDYTERAAPKLVLEVLRSLKHAAARQATTGR
jgi:peroxiredoxin